MPLMPGSPRPSPSSPREEDDGVYRSIFQQPLIEIPPAAPSYAWFEFLLHPDALQRHVREEMLVCCIVAMMRWRDERRIFMPLWLTVCVYITASDAPQAERSGCA